MVHIVKQKVCTMKKNDYIKANQEAESGHEPSTTNENECRAENIATKAMMDLLSLEYVLRLENGGKLDTETKSILDEAYHLAERGVSEDRIVVLLRLIPRIRNKVLESADEESRSKQNNRGP